MHERLQVLTMLVEGNLTIEQAAQFLDILYLNDRPQMQEHNAVVAASSRQSPPKFTVAELLEMAEEGVDANFIRRVQEAGLTDLSVPQMIEMVQVGAEPELVRAVREAQMSQITFDDVLEMAQAGVDPAFIRSLHTAHLTSLSATKIIEMVEAGVDPNLVSVASHQ